MFLDYNLTPEVFQKRLERQKKEKREPWSIHPKVTVAMHNFFRVKRGYQKKNKKYKYEQFLTEEKKINKREKALKRYYNNLEENQIKAREGYHKNKDIINELRKANRFKLKVEVLEYYSKGKLECNCCGNTSVLNLTIDHINGNGREHRRKLGTDGKRFYQWLKKNNFPKGYQVLCFYCNIRKGNKEECGCGLKPNH